MANPARTPDPRLDPTDPDRRSTDPLAPDPRVSPANSQTVNRVESRTGGTGILIAAVVLVLALIAYFAFAPGDDVEVAPDAAVTDTAPAPDATAPAAPADTTPAPDATAPAAPADTAPAPDATAPAAPADTAPAPDATAPAAPSDTTAPAPESSAPADTAPADTAPADTAPADTAPAPAQ